jgi:hypothetical protein
MLEIAQLLESALASNRSGLRKAAMRSVSRMAPGMTLREVLDSEPGEAIRELTLRELGSALAPGRSDQERPERAVAGGGVRRRLQVAAPVESDQSDEERTYRMILDALSSGPQTIGQLGKTVELETTELRGYLAWMKRMGKVVSSGRARATRYSLA